MEKINVGKKIVLTAAAFRTTPSGDKPETTDGEPVWTAVPVGVAGLFPQSDPWVCEATNIKPGTCKVTCTADADKTSGVRNISSAVDITCLAGEADKLVITAGPEVDL